MYRERQVIMSSHHVGMMADHLLRVDATYPPNTIKMNNHGTWDCSIILMAAMDALRLHATAGLTFDISYNMRSPIPRYAGFETFSVNSVPRRFNFLANISTLPEIDFGKCRATCDRLIHKTWNDAAQHDKILRLAMEYHRLSFTFERAEHAFLIVMVAYEAIFKKDDEKAHHAAHRISRFLGETKVECDFIEAEFKKHSITRNSIAHGVHCAPGTGPVP
jgi:hypothetical protein